MDIKKKIDDVLNKRKTKRYTVYYRDKNKEDILNHIFPPLYITDGKALFFKKEGEL